MQPQDAFADPGSFTTTLLVAYMDEFGTEGLHWDAVTIAMTLEQWRGKDTSAIQFDKLMAGVSVLTSDAFYQNLPDFLVLVNSLNGKGASHGVFDPPDAAELAWALSEGVLLSPPERDDEEPFCPEIRAYIGKTLDREGIMSPPDVLAIGTRAGSSRLSSVVAEYADRPDLLAAIRHVEDHKTADITATIKTGLHTVFEQLDDLQLTSGDARALLERLQKKP